MQRAFLSIAIVTLCCASALGQQYAAIWSFGARGDGISPWGRVALDRQGNLVGTAYSGGSKNAGIVYQLTRSANGWSETVLYNFCSLPSCADGANPWGGLILDEAGNLYGTTTEGGQFSAGTVFRLSRPAHLGGSWLLTTLWSFDVGNGWAPVGRLTWDASGNLFGTTSGGGQGEDECGTVFELSPTPEGWSETLLHSMGRTTDGCLPYDGVAFDKAGNIFVTTERGGAVGCDGFEGCGTVFELSQQGQTWTETMLTQFGGNGASPYSEVAIGPDGSLYITLSIFGPRCNLCGGIVKMTNVGGRWISTYHYFHGPDGEIPVGGLLLDPSMGNAYGTTLGGGVGEFCGNTDGCGTAFVTHHGKETVLYSFCSQPGCIDGLNPATTLITDGKGNLYGTTNYGGTYGQGVVFELTP